MSKRQKKKSRIIQFSVPAELAPATVVPTVSNTGRRTRHVETTIETPVAEIPDQASPEVWQETSLWGIDNEPVTMREPGGIVVKVELKPKRNQNSDEPLITWRDEYRQPYVDAQLASDGRGRHKETCASFGCREKPSFRCRDCFGRWMYCRACILHRHQTTPLHWMEEWMGLFFERRSLASDLKQDVQLGHVSALMCPFRVAAHKDFVVIHINGIHQINLYFCGCEDAPSQSDQLLEVGWWPSTPKAPQTAATFEVLRTCQVLNLNEKSALTDFYKGLEQVTCGKGLTVLPDRLTQWMIMIREWQHTKMLKHKARGHDPEGVKATLPGELAIPCRACPLPGINLPDDWNTAPEDRQWLYALFLALDANFKQKARLRSGRRDEVALGPGWGTFVPNKPYLEYVSQFANEEEISHCVGFAAMWSANRKRSNGLRATGIGAVSCARHELYRANGMGDLQFGERYPNMDFLTLCSIAHELSRRVCISYDIACQWSINWLIRLNRDTTPEDLRGALSKDITFLVPKFHLEAHTPKCHAPYSYNFAKGVGRTDGEGVERNWSTLNGIARSLSQMTPGGRWDSMDNHCNFANWCKTVDLPSSLLRKMTKAIPQAIIHHRALTYFTEGLRQEDAKRVEIWEAQVIKWENDHTEYCPYDLPDIKTTFAEVKRQLTVEEHDKIANGEVVMNFEGLSPGSFIVTGLELERAQQELLVEVKRSSKTTLQETALVNRRTTLLKRIQQFVAVRAGYLPGLDSYLAGLKTHQTTKSAAESIPLHLPSSIPAEKRASVCIGGVDQIEDRFRFGQATEALTQLRLQLAKRTCAARYNHRNVDSQRSHTRFRTLTDQTENKIKASQLQYNVARAALLSLRGPGPWEKTLKVLKMTDIHGLGEHVIVGEEREIEDRTRKMAGLDSAEGSVAMEAAYSALLLPLPSTDFNPQLATGEGTRTLSWIWYSTTGEELDNSQTEAYLRVEWLRCRARAMRWKEVILLVEEEMRRSLEFCRWQASWWESQAGRRASITPPHVAEGIAAYAFEQAADEREREKLWTAHWKSIRERATLVLGKLLSGQVDESESAVQSLNITIEEDTDDSDADADDSDVDDDLIKD